MQITRNRKLERAEAETSAASELDKEWSRVDS